MKKLRGNCYVAAEALYHILGGREGPWVVMRMRLRNDTHWYLKHRYWGTILDPSRCQFHTLPDYSKGKRTGFLTRRPSKRAIALIERLTWQSNTQSTTKSTSKKSAGTSTTGRTSRSRW